MTAARPAFYAGLTPSGGEIQSLYPSMFEVTWRWRGMANRTNESTRIETGTSEAHARSRVAKQHGFVSIQRITHVGDLAPVYR